MAQLDDIVGSTMQKLKDLALTITPSSPSLPTTAPKNSPGRTADKLRTREERERRSRAVSAVRLSSAGPGTSQPAKLRTAFSVRPIVQQVSSKTYRLFFC
jgi:hypothetical protein